jgi:hypothetical protein
MDWTKWKCRCSSISKILSDSRKNPVLTEKQAIRLSELEARKDLSLKQSEEMAELLVRKGNSAKMILSDTYISYLMEVYSWETAGKIAVSKEMDIEFLQKGKAVEPDSIELLSFIDDVPYKKNVERVQNEFLSGIPDVYAGETLIGCRRLKDLKSIWDYPGFLCKLHSGLANGNKEQVQGYGDITGCEDLEVVNALVDMPEITINDYKRRLMYKMEVATDEDPEYKAAAAQMERSMRFTDIPAHKRVFKMKVEPFTEFERQAVYDRVKVGRDWLCVFDETYQQLNK